jgi:hypothetical protein
VSVRWLNPSPGRRRPERRRKLAVHKDIGMVFAELGLAATVASWSFITYLEAAG